MLNARTLKITLFVIGLHLLMLYAVQSGLAQRVVTAIAPREIVAILISPERPQPEVRSPPHQVASPKQPSLAKPAVSVQQSVARPVTPAQAPEPTPAREVVPVSNHVPTPPSTEPSTPSTTSTTSTPSAPASAPAAPAVSAAPPAPRRVNMTQIQCLQIEPRYPQMSRRLGEEGTAAVRLTIGESGQVEKAELSSPSGSPRLDQAALEAARAYKCQPYIENGHPVRANALQPFVFKLD